MNHKCPVCGYNGLRRPPLNYSICPCCGIEFGYDDIATSHDVLRNEWILNGAKWKSERIPAPDDWSPVTQLLNIGYTATEEDINAMCNTPVKAGANAEENTRKKDKKKEKAA
jgi:hypothetical protein